MIDKYGEKTAQVTKYGEPDTQVNKYGKPDAPVVLIQMVDDHDLEVMESEVAEIRRLAGDDFLLAAIKVNSWNHDLSPWEAPAVFGNEDFGDGAAETLARMLEFIGEMRNSARAICEDGDGRADMDRCTDRYEYADRTYYIGGYSLAGLFALWAAYQTDFFSGVAAASPSMWFPGFVDYMKENEIQTGAVYLSLGDKEEKTRNPVMATVGDRIREASVVLAEQGVDTTLEWNQGNHFRDPDIRTAKAFAWVMADK